jgi:hypothetical protein
LELAINFKNQTGIAGSLTFKSLKTKIKDLSTLTNNNKDNSDKDNPEHLHAFLKMD